MCETNILAEVIYGQRLLWFELNGAHHLTIIAVRINAIIKYALSALLFNYWYKYLLNKNEYNVVRGDSSNDFLISPASVHTHFVESHLAE